jgi:hypothetical protein
MRIVSFQNNRGVRPGVLLDDNHVLDFRLAAEKRGPKNVVARCIDLFWH